MRKGSGMKYNAFMKNNFKILALIPARAGSKRIKNKNIRLLAGKPLIAWTIEAAKTSKLINRIIVSTDSVEIAAVARKFGAETPFLRPKKISGEFSTEFEYHQHAIDWLKKNEQYSPDMIVNLYPTTPFRKAATIDNAVNLILKHKNADSLRSVKKCAEHPYKMWAVRGDYLEPFVKTKNQANHTFSYQLLPEVYIQNASIYITRPSTLRKCGNTVGRKVLKFIMDEKESVDLNTELDFLYAENLIKNNLL